MPRRVQPATAHVFHDRTPDFVAVVKLLVPANDEDSPLARDANVVTAERPESVSRFSRCKSTRISAAL
jgi:hypothetical protein